MTRTVETSVDIDAPADVVWSVLTDFAAYPSWNPFLLEVSGRLRKRARLDVRISQPGAPPVRVQPRILRVAPQEELRWRGKVLVQGILDGEHWFRLEPLGDGRTRLHHGETFDGVLVPMFGTPFLSATRKGFERMNAALKARAEDMARKG
jgi:hypothetical protein